MLKQTLKALMLVFAAGLAQASEPYQAGEDYQVLSYPVHTEDAERIEVVEVFGYLCPHCNNFEPVLEHWSEQLDAEQAYLKRVPAVFNRNWENYARAYYTSELLGIADKTHAAMFDAIHLQRKRFNSAEDLADFYAKLGADRAKFLKTFNSFAVQSRLNLAESRIRSYQIEGVPTLIVNGKYRITAGDAGGHKQMLEVADYLIKKEQLAKK